MREIKFRGLRTDTLVFVYGYYVRCSAAHLGIDVPLAKARICHVIISEGQFFHVTPESVGQCTGIRDKLGIEMFEHDVVRVGERGVTSITFLEGCFYTIIKGSKYRCGGWNTPSIVVLGNINQSPELLGREQ